MGRVVVLDLWKHQALCHKVSLNRPIGSITPKKIESDGAVRHTKWSQIIIILSFIIMGFIGVGVRGDRSMEVPGQ